MVRQLIFATACLATAPVSAFAGGCQTFFAAKTYAAPVVAYYPQVYYAAGRDIEAEAIAAKVAKIVVGQLRAELRAAPNGVGQPAATRQTALAQHCARCHSGANPKHGLTIDGTSSLDCHSILAAIRAVANDTMPQGAKLTPQQKGQLLDELLALEQTADKSPPVAVPVPDGELK